MPTGMPLGLMPEATYTDAETISRPAKRSCSTPTASPKPPNPDDGCSNANE